MKLRRLLLLALLVPATFMAGISTRAAMPLTSSQPADSTTAEETAVLNSALREFHAVGKAERKSRLREARKMLRQYKATKKKGANPDGDIVFLAILAVLLPPLAVYLKEKTINKRFWIDLLLWFLFILPGIVFAMLIVFGVI